jgi:hypothetical protein
MASPLAAAASPAGTACLQVPRTAPPVKAASLSTVVCGSPSEGAPEGLSREIPTRNLHQPEQYLGTVVDAAMEASGVAKLTRDLGKPETAAAAALAVCMVCEAGNPPSSLLALLGPLVQSLSFTPAVQQNSLSAMAGLCALVPGAREELCSATPALVALCSRDDTPAAVRLNALEAVAVLAASSMAVDALLLCDAHTIVLGELGLCLCVTPSGRK